MDETDGRAFAEHANEPGEGRVIRTKKACTEDFHTKVYMALVAWVRHNKTDYDDKRSAAKDAAYAGYLEAKEWGCSYEERGEELDQARADSSQARNELHAQYTTEAVEWLKSIEKQTPQVVKLAALPMNSLSESAPAHIDAAQPTAEAECSVASGQGNENTFFEMCQGMPVSGRQLPMHGEMLPPVAKFLAPIPCAVY
jgi:hypothetical protein